MRARAIPANQPPVLLQVTRWLPLPLLLLGLHLPAALAQEAASPPPQLVPSVVTSTPVTAPSPGPATMTPAPGSSSTSLPKPATVPASDRGAVPQPTTPLVNPPAPERGGAWPFLLSCLCGPRIGLEYNEGKQPTSVEYLNFFVRVIVPIQAMGRNGIPGFCASCCIGPRVGMQLDRRKIRTLEWFRVVPFLNVYAAIVNSFEAADGMTMSEIAEAEHLER
jgi:hypothetical protein